MSDPYQEGAAAARARRLRNLAIGGVLVAFVLLIFVITLVRLGSHALQPHL